MDRLLWHGSVNFGSTNECHRQHMLPPPIFLTVLSFLPQPPRDQQDAGSTRLAPSPQGHLPPPAWGPNIPSRGRMPVAAPKGTTQGVPLLSCRAVRSQATRG